MRGVRCVAWAMAVVGILGIGASGRTEASGTSPYLPLNLSPEIERKIERVMVLAGKPVLTRPIAIAKVLAALPRARKHDPALCAQIDSYLDRYFAGSGVTNASGEVAGANHSTQTIPNERGERIDSPVDASVDLFYRPYDHLLFSAGAVAYAGTEGRITPDGTMVSFGNQYAQMDIGWRDHWFSPLTDSSMLISTEAPPMPSFTLSNQVPIGSLGFEYELFWARMSSSDEILYKNRLNEGAPKLAGAHIGFSPLPGWSISGNGTWQYGGGGRPENIHQFFDSLFSRTVIAVTPQGASTDSRFANRTVSVTSAYTFPTRNPFEAYVEYGARDTLHGNRLRFHDTSLSAGVHFPELYKHFDLTIEASEWQNLWYSDYVWLEGLTEYGYPIGNWGADWRLSNADAVGAQSVMAQLGWTLPSGDEVDARVRTLQNQPYGVGNAVPVDYRRATMLTLEYAQPRDGYTRGLQLDVGRDVYGKGYGRLAAFARFDGGNRTGDRGYADSEPDSDSDEEAEARHAGLERFADVGLSGGRLQLNLGGFSTAQEGAQPATKNVISPHIGLGVRKQVAAHQDLGVRVEVDDVSSNAMLGLRIIDYRYRLDRHLAVGAFFGFARYAAPTPAQGYYEGAGIQWRDLLPHWDLALEARYFDHLQRDKVLASDPQNGDPVEWYTLFAPTLTLSRRF
ncbi:MAG TPA: capsule assembly Wzi family protein [Steroidobacteraceae bacterium]|nr:capsule assembly Wzi family protein [Steroidobacteraceae bacterium]